MEALPLGAPCVDTCPLLPMLDAGVTAARNGTRSVGPPPVGVSTT